MYTGKTHLQDTISNFVCAKRFIYLFIYLSYRIRSFGAAALNMCMVALGSVDAFFEFGIHAWDVAAGDLIVREAGGVSIDPAGKQLQTLCISHSQIRDTI